MKITEFRKLIREEIKKALNEDYGNDIINDLIKNIQVDRTAQQRKFVTWAKTAAAKKNITSLSFQSASLIDAALSKLSRKGVLTADMVADWESSPAGSEENDLFQGLTVLADKASII